MEAGVRKKFLEDHKELLSAELRFIIKKFMELSSRTKEEIYNQINSSDLEEQYDGAGNIYRLALDNLDEFDEFCDAASTAQDGADIGANTKLVFFLVYFQTCLKKNSDGIFVIQPLNELNTLIQTTTEHSIGNLRL
jgi:hypothetical protein